MTQFDRRTFLVTTAGAALAAAAPAFAQQTGEDARLRAILDQMFEARVDDSPRFATSLGLDRGARAALKSKLDDNSSSARARRLEQARGWVNVLKTVDREKLSAASKVDLDVVLYSNEQVVLTRKVLGSYVQNHRVMSLGVEHFRWKQPHAKQLLALLGLGCAL